MKTKAALEAVEFAKQLQMKGTGVTDKEIDKLCKMAGVKLVRADMEKYSKRIQNALSKVKLTARERREKDPERKYFTPPEVAKMTGRSRSTISKLFKNDPGVRKQTFAGPGRRKISTLLISREALKRRFPDLEI